MGWIKLEHGTLINTENVKAMRIKVVRAEQESLPGMYYVVANVLDNQEYHLTGIVTKEGAHDILARIEDWLESGARGIFEVPSHCVPAP